MRDPELHATIRAFAEEATFHLAGEVAAGAELEFEVAESPGRFASLYQYRPLTAEFISGRLGQIVRLPAAVKALGAIQHLEGVDAYLEARGMRRIPSARYDRAREALRVFLEQLHDELTEFTFDDARFERAYGELEAVVYDGMSRTVVIAPLHGVRLEADSLELVPGLELIRGDGYHSVPPDAVFPVPGIEAEAATLLRMTVERPRESDEDDEPASNRAAAAISHAVIRFAGVVTALRLYDAGAVGAGPIGWVRADTGPWRAIPIGKGVRPGPGITITPEQEDELRAFCNLVAKRAPDGGPVAWALQRFEAGMEHDYALESLTDHLLALRALLEPEGPNTGKLATRLAAICAVEEDRPALIERVAHAVSLERAVVAGVAPATDHAEMLVDELAAHLRALLRDLLCGHLEGDLCEVADRLAAGEAVTPRAHPVPDPLAEAPEPETGEIEVVDRRSELYDDQDTETFLIY
jgi:hypothetical protein